MIRRLVVSLLLVLLLAPALLASRPLSAADLLRNGGFEAGFHSQAGIAGEVPDGWQAVNLSGNPTIWSTIAFADGGWVERIEGENSVLIAAEDYYPRGLPFETVLYQTIDGITPGEPYSLTGWVQLLYGGSAWPDNNGGKTVPPDPYALGAWIGIDPTGGTDPRAETVEWGEHTWENYAFINLRAAGVAQANRVTVFVRVLSKWQQSATTVILDGFNFQPAPRASVEALSASSSSPLTLRWEGVLPPALTALGDFALYYDVQRQNGDGSWSTIAEDLDSESYTLTSSDGETVTLRVAPKSWVPKGAARGFWPPSQFHGVPTAPVTTLVDSAPPTTRIEPLPAWVEPEPFDVHWSGQDAGSGIQSFDVQWRESGGQWQAWLTATTKTSATFGKNGEPAPLAGGDSVEFRVRARDNAGKQSPWPMEPQARTNVAGAWLDGQVVGNRGKPLMNVTIAATPFDYPDPPPPPGPDGRYRLPLPLPGAYTIAIGQGGSSLPETTVTIEQSPTTMNWLVPPADNAVESGDFEGDASAWSGDGWSLGTPRASGTGAARLEPGGAISQTITTAGPAQVALAWLYQGNDPDATLVVADGTREWRVPVGETAGRWNFWHQPTEAGGPRSLRLSLEASDGILALDDVSVGSPQAEIHAISLPLIVRP